MPTNLAIDDRLIDEARAIGGFRETRTSSRLCTITPSDASSGRSSTWPTAPPTISGFDHKTARRLRSTDSMLSDRRNY